MKTLRTITAIVAILAISLGTLVASPTDKKANKSERKVKFLVHKLLDRVHAKAMNQETQQKDFKLVVSINEEGYIVPESVISADQELNKLVHNRVLDSKIKVSEELKGKKYAYTIHMKPNPYY